MDKNFLRLSDAVETVRQKQEEREQVGQNIAEVKAKAAALYSRISEEYREKEKKIDERMETAETENRGNKERIIELTRQQIQKETAGEPFEMQGELDRLKAEVTTYPQKVEALQSLKAEVAIAAADIERLAEYRREWQELTASRTRTENELQEILVQIRENDIAYCLATFEVVPGLREFLPDVMSRDIESMRKESGNDE